MQKHTPNYSINFKRSAITFFILIVILGFPTVYARPRPVSGYPQTHLKEHFSLSTVLQSHMVVQQNKPFKLWGYGPAGATVSIQADWMATPIQVICDNQGHFEGIISVPRAVKGDYTPHSIRLQTGSQVLQLKDLLIGDLWFLSGQSNMQFAVREMLDSTQMIASANPHIRLLNVALNFSATPIDSINGKWTVCSPASVRDFSAVGYSFGEKLQRALHIPIGLVFSGIGASAVQAFVPEAVLQEDTLLNRVYLRPYLNSPKSKEKINGGFSFEKVTRPFLLYNALIHPFIRLSIKGFCWYQGATNYKDRAPYTSATIAMIKSWRKAFQQGVLPFNFVQIAPYAHDKMDVNIAGDAFFREAQQHILQLNNTNMVLTIDVGDPANLHPKNKKPVGDRLAAVALNRTYGRLNQPYLGPALDYVHFTGDTAMIHFQPATLFGGLHTKDAKAPTFFFLAGSDRVFHPATAAIRGNTVVVYAKQVKRPVAVRYAFFNYPVTNLQNGAGLPAVPFRTDNWPEKPENY